MHAAATIIAGACFYVVSAAIGLADEIPALNAAPLCHGIAAQGTPWQLGDPTASFQGCMNGEKNDRATLAQKWHTFSAQSRKDCTDEAHTSGVSSYSVLLTCLETDRDVGHR
jgi:hypothetical protein